MLIHILALAGGLVLLTLGADGLVSAAVTLARRFGMPALVIGIVIVGFGTSLPELAVSVKAALDNAPDIALGNVIGSNTANILLILGLTTLLGPIAAARSGYLRDLAVMMAASVTIALLALTGVLSWVAGLVMLFALIVYMSGALLRGGACEAESPHADMPALVERPVWQTTAIAIGGLAGLLVGASLMVSGAIGISRVFGMPEAVIGLTVVAIGTSLPELAAALAAAYRKQPDLVLGNIIGSNIFNIFGILGISSIIQTIPVSAQMARVDIPVMLVTALFLTLVIIIWQRVGRLAGSSMLAAYLGYTWYLFGVAAAG